MYPKRLIQAVELLQNFSAQPGKLDSDTAQHLLSLCLLDRLGCQVFSFFNFFFSSWVGLWGFFCTAQVWLSSSSLCLHLLVRTGSAHGAGAQNHPNYNSRERKTLHCTSGSSQLSSHIKKHPGPIKTNMIYSCHLSLFLS